MTGIMEFEVNEVSKNKGNALGFWMAKTSNETAPVNEDGEVVIKKQPEPITVTKKNEDEESTSIVTIEYQETVTQNVIMMNLEWGLLSIPTNRIIARFHSEEFAKDFALFARSYSGWLKVVRIKENGNS